MKIPLPPDYTADHEQLTLRYLRLGRFVLNFAEWKTLFTGFDLLHGAAVEINQALVSFRTVHRTHVDELFADQ